MRMLNSQKISILYKWIYKFKAMKSNPQSFSFFSLKLKNSSLNSYGTLKAKNSPDNTT